MYTSFSPFYITKTTTIAFTNPIINKAIWIQNPDCSTKLSNRFRTKRSPGMYVQSRMKAFDWTGYWLVVLHYRYCHYRYILIDIYVREFLQSKTKKSCGAGRLGLSLFVNVITVTSVSSAIIQCDIHFTLSWDNAAHRLTKKTIL